MTMKTLFLSHDGGGNSSNQRKFQKPNILRRKTKEPVRKPGVGRPFETLVSVDSASDQQNLYSVPKEVIIRPEIIIPMKQTALPVSSDVKFGVLKPNNVGNIQLSLNQVNSSDNSRDSVSQCAVINVESFLNGSALVQSTTDSETNILNQNLKRGWCLDYVDEHNETHHIIIEDAGEPQQVRLHSADGSAVECIMPNAVMPESAIPVSAIPVSAIPVSAMLESEIPESAMLQSEMPESITPETEITELRVDSSTVDQIRMTNVMGELVTTSVVAEDINGATTSLLEDNFKCDKPGCHKKFKTKERLTRHKRTHLASNRTPKEPRHITVECPARKRGSKEVTVCGELFLFREALTKHIKEHHTPEDAMYICSICGRRFFWCVGLRAHVRSHSARARPVRVLACGWEGCGRSFRLPCRLREHQRAHTGDKPYPCDYPNCNWSFRTASKLMRHARRHTGERRHACTVCGHAFPRREHLRKHTHTHHARQHHCAHQGCQRRFMSVEALTHHMRTRHKRDHFSLDADSHQPDWDDMFTISESPDDAITIKSTLSEPTTLYSTPKVTKTETKRQTKTKAQSKKTKETVDWKVCSTSSDVQDKSQELKWQYPTESETENDWQVYGNTAEASNEDEGEWHAARTHCTWPLAPRPGDHAQEDVQVDLSEGSESNTYTIRSDLFLHGNLITNEDSEHIPSAAVSLPSTATDSGLSLLDAHPATDLMQEDLMYTDAAVDESSFRVLLLNGDSNLY